MNRATGNGTDLYRQLEVPSSGRPADPMFRSPNASHLSTANLMPQYLDVLLTYDARVLTAASSYGLTAAGAQ